MKFAGAARLQGSAAHGVRAQVGHEPCHPIHWYGLNPSISRPDTSSPDPWVQRARPAVRLGRCPKRPEADPAASPRTLPLTSIFGDLRLPGASIKLRHPGQTHVLVYTIPWVHVPSSDSFIETNVLNGSLSPVILKVPNVGTN